MLRRVVCCVSLCLLLGRYASGYSVLTHEAIIDSAWKDGIVPLLLQRFPGATPEQLLEAHAYAYGGAIVQDMGYYPFGSKFFSDLTHYVRSGDLVLALLAEAQSLDEYAFALGAMAHYAADNAGHPVATNLAVPIMYPKLERKFGKVMTYADNPAAHLKVEFSFDVVEVAQGNFAPEAYHDFIGFQVAKPALERAFLKTYSIEMSSVFLNEDLAIGTFRWTVSSILPTMTKAAWSLKKNDIMKSQPGITKRKFIFNISRASYRKKWGDVREKPGFSARFMAFLFRLIPKIGPFRALAFHAPTPAVETMFMKSFNDTLARYRKLLEAQGQGTLQLPNENFDTGAPLMPGTYSLADDAYAKLLDRVSGKPVSPELRASILAYYSNPGQPYTTQKDPAAWQKVLSELDALKNAPQP